VAEPWQYIPCPFCGASMEQDCNMVPEADGRWQQIVCGACGARGPEVKRCLPFATALQSWNHRTPVPGVAGTSSGLTEQLTRSMAAIEQDHDPLCMAVLRGKDCTCGVAAAPPAFDKDQAQPGDTLDMAYINSLPHPFMGRMLGGAWWPIHDFEVQTGLVRIDVCGKLDVKHIGDFTAFRDGAGVERRSIAFYVDANEDERAPVSGVPGTPTLPDPLGCRACVHPECGRHDGPRSVECRAMADGACARPVGVKGLDDAQR
jgi:hypothetical protein